MIRVGVTTGLYYIARAEELATSLKKIGYALSKGSNSIEISGDTPHEIDYTLGKEIRALAEKQGIHLCFHGSLTTPFEIPERTDWRDAQDHVCKSIRSAVFSGCKYVLFHACLHFWLEMITYTSSKLEIVMCDHHGRFISEIFFENKKMRDWFAVKMWQYERQYPQQILSEEELQEASGRVGTEIRIWETEENRRRLAERLKKYPIIMTPYGPEQDIKPEERKRIENEVVKDVSMEGGKMYSENYRKYMGEMVKERMQRDPIGNRRWRVDNWGKLTDAYDIMAHFMFYNRDPIWIAMAEIYKDVLASYKMDYSDDWWVDKAWRRAQDLNDRDFKQFWYAAIGAKFLEGHMRDAMDFLNKRLIDEIKSSPFPPEDIKKLIDITKNLKITIEMPDAREPRYAGLYILWHPKQIYTAIKTIRKTLGTDRLFMTVDWEHIAGHGVDPLIEKDYLKKLAPDFGKYVLSVHSNAPNPLHAHYPIELGDMEVYRLNWFLRETGFGKQGFDVYLWFERGGGDDPFKQSVDTLKLCAKFLEKDVPPDHLPEEYYGIKMTGMDYWRQEQIMRDHRFEPLKDLMEVPEEEWGLLSSSATKKGKAKEFKKAEMR